jgi:hypothetical protein
LLYSAPDELRQPLLGLKTGCARDQQRVLVRVSIDAAGPADAR